MLKIGIDVKSIDQPITGIGRYTSESLNEFLSLRKNDKLYLYSPHPIVDKRLIKKNVNTRSSNFKNRFQKMMWSQTILPYGVMRDSVDVFWGPAHRLPHFLPSNVVKISTIHDFVWKHEGKTMRPVSRYIESILMPLAIKESDLLVAVSESTASDVRSAFPEVSDKIRVVYPGVSTIAKDQNKIDPLVPAPYILFVGTLEPRKNLYRLMKAFSLLRIVNKDISLVVAGGKGWGNVDVEGWRNELGLGNSIVQLGYVTDQQLANLYANSLFIAMPSLYEGFGFPLIEAMSFSKAAVTSNLSSMPEVGGKGVVLVNPLDVHSISGGLKELLNVRKRKKFETEAKKNAAKFSWKNSAEQLSAIFDEAAEIRKYKLSSGLR